MSGNRALADELARQAVAVGASAPEVRGGNWRQATVATVGSSGTVTTTDGIVARRLESYLNPAVGDLIRIDASSSGDWTTPGRIATTAVRGWTPYTPTWTAGTTNPTVGNAVRTGRYQRFEKTCHLAIRLVPGSTTGFGSGAYLFGLPFPAADDVVEYVGSARLTAGSTYIGQCFAGPGATEMNVTFPASATPATAANMTQAAPATFASGHILRLSLTYQTA
ncbi:hypothetical protein ABTX84_19065 [Streptomyces sp. NPDC095614]|uniref:hypothetical protein n=1 Tax=Streptomyces sp. NPDC095614 TaxID=3156692 RepID=UPI0033168E44